MAEFIQHPEIALPEKGNGHDPANYGEQFKAVYKYDYPAIFREIANGTLPKVGTYRQLIKDDLFFIVFFVQGVPVVNCPFGVESCHTIEGDSLDGGLSRTQRVDIWAREHLKSTCGTMGLTVKRIINNPESTTAIFSFKKPAADKFLMGIKETLEKPLMIQCFPDILYDKPETQSSSWSIQGGIRVKRQSTSRKENTVEAFGLIEGMPTGGHFDHRVYDDVETTDLCESPEQMEKCFSKFEMSDNLGTNGGTEEVWGTFYSHAGPLVKIRDKQDIKGGAMYLTRIRPATDDGTIHGNPVFLSQERLDKLKVSEHFNTQQLCNPTPSHDMKLQFSQFSPIEPQFLPKKRIKFVIVDPAGDDSVQAGKNNDSWAILCLSVNPAMDDLGTSQVFLEDIVSDQMGLSEAIDAACQIYMRNGRIEQIGVEKVANDTTYEHIRKALKAKGRHIHIGSGRNKGNMVLLSPSGRNKNRRIEAALSWPLANSKLFYSTAIPKEHIDKIRQEMELFPYFHVDILDAFAYLYDLLKDFEFYSFEDEEEHETEPVDDAGRSDHGGY